MSLLPCPFCGGAAEIIHGRSGALKGFSFSATVRCQKGPDCHQSAVGKTRKGAEERAIQAWNTRGLPCDATNSVDIRLHEPTRAQLAGLIESLEKMMKTAKT